MLDTIQKRITALRKEKGLTRREVAEAIDEPYTSYCHLEDGSMEIKASTLIKLSIFYKQSADWIVGIDSTEKSTPPESKWNALREMLKDLPEPEVKELMLYVRFLKWKVQNQNGNTE